MKIRTLDWNQADDRAAFIDLAWDLYASTNWVPPLKASLAQELGPDNLFFRHGRAAVFVAEREGQPVGRIVASVDDSLERSDIGHFGYFETVDDPEVATALLSAAEDWLRVQGKTLVHGPINLNIYNSYRLQTEGFDKPAFLGEPRALPYYQELLGTAGYTTVTTWRSWDIPGQALGPMRAAMAQGGTEMPADYRLTTLAQSEEAQLLKDLHQVALEIFAENYGYATIDFDEFLQVYSGLLGLFRRHPELLGICYHEDRPVGFGFIYPDYAPFFRAADGEIAAMAHFGEAQAKGMVYHTFGFLRAYRHTVLPYAMFAQSFDEVASHQCRYIIGALAKEGRTAYDKIGPHTRAYAVYEKAL